MRKISGRFGAVAMVTALMGMMLAAAIAAPAQKFESLAELDSTHGVTPLAGLVQGVDGNFYGTTSNLGAYGQGTVIKLTPQGALTTLYSFCVQPNCTDGAEPEGSLIQGADGNLYGTTVGGGANPYSCYPGCGTMFKITPAGTLTTVYSFCSQPNCTDGANPHDSLVQATDGNFYGTTESGGYYDGRIHGCGDVTCGTVFKITPTGTLTTLYSFCADGCVGGGGFPVAGLIQATDGNFYGTMPSGTVYKITAKGAFSVFSSAGENPQANLVQATDGNFYGTSENGGAYNDGTVFKITQTGAMTTLYSFDGYPSGSYPKDTLIQGSDGALYGTAYGGGISEPCEELYFASVCGTIFRITLTGELTTLYNFCSQTGCADGAFPYGALVQGTNGDLYGTTDGGGVSNPCEFGCGTVFEMKVGLGPFVETVLTSGRVGAAVRILGNKLEGTTSVTFNGTPATFKVVASSLISATVPAGATTGPVQVVTPSGTLTSNVNFRVEP